MLQLLLVMKIYIPLTFLTFICCKLIIMEYKLIAMFVYSQPDRSALNLLHMVTVWPVETCTKHLKWSTVLLGCSVDNSAQQQSTNRKIFIHTSSKLLPLTALSQCYNNSNCNYTTKFTCSRYSRNNARNSIIIWLYMYT